jgi:hypothetical protein
MSLKEGIVALVLVVFLAVYATVFRCNKPVTNNIIINKCLIDTTGQGYVNMMIADSVLCPDGKCKCR